MQHEAERQQLRSAVERLLHAQATQLDAFVDGYVLQLADVVSRQPALQPSVRQAIVDAERDRVRSLLNQLLSVEAHAALSVFDAEAASRTHAAQVAASVVRVQALVRGFLCRRVNRKLLRDERHRNRCAREMLDTERAYCRSLQLVHDVYLRPLKAQPYVDADDVAAIFSNWELIMKLNGTLLESLENRIGAEHWHSRQTVAGEFLRMAPWLKVYIQYVNNYNRAMSTLHELGRDEPRFTEFLRAAKTKAEAMELAAYLIMPVQRIPRYILLLQDLRAHTLPSHPDFDSLALALAKLQEVAATINESNRRAESMSRILRLQQLLLEAPRELQAPTSPSCMPNRYMMTQDDA
eukprot:TRINITY_DN3488_c2_g1_i1.p3 TRINITY_DN3488_c2_g1~~TRINITY_DN3488_c2_g1_i1.p3  ORF type:complete len:351 (+),score=150.07 TRINITY_DN3488_c2_g1_i1:1271-2323(+)